jgi:2-polyprenyl-6-methoxyphenol hydroxylase-like FAD-dependent oxidoreductase
MSVDVVIIGGGPNGLLTACELALGGVRPVVLERLAERPTRPKANGLVGRVVQALHYRGLYERLARNPRPPWAVPQFQFGALTLNLSILDDNPLFILPIPQRELEAALEERAHELGVEIRRGHELVRLSQTEDGVVVDVAGPDGAYQISARYLVGADGAHSQVRKQSGIGFPGLTDDRFVGRTGQVAILPPVALPGSGELEVAGFGRLRPATFTRTDKGLFAYGMFQPGIYRVSVHEWDSEPLPDSDDMPIEELRGAVRRVLGGDVPMVVPPDGRPAALTRLSSGNSRQADRYREGRVFLVGDAAHVHSGIGGPGLNLGMQDAINLAWKLAAVICGDAPERLLDTYQSERFPVCERVLMSTRAQTALIGPGAQITALRQLFDELLTDRGTIRHIAELMAGADVRYDMGEQGPVHPLTGGWMPNLVLDNGKTVADLMHRGRGVLLNLAGRAELTTDRVDVVSATAKDAPADAVLIRPDGYVAWAGDTPEGLGKALDTWFGGALSPSGRALDGQ